MKHIERNVGIAKRAMKNSSDRLNSIEDSTIQSEYKEFYELFDNRHDDPLTIDIKKLFTGFLNIWVTMIGLSADRMLLSTLVK